MLETFGLNRGEFRENKEGEIKQCLKQKSLLGEIKELKLRWGRNSSNRENIMANNRTYNEIEVQKKKSSGIFFDRQRLNCK